MLWKKIKSNTRQFIKEIFNKKDKFSFLEGIIISKIKKIVFLTLFK